MMSGMTIKMGIYGLVRFSGWLPLPSAAGWVIVVLGVASAVLGVAFALGQHDLKRLLAYHSVENIGIILIGLGFALVAAAHGNAAWGGLALAGGLLHVWNHGLFKSLLFLGAGSVLHATGTRGNEPPRRPVARDAVDRRGSLRSAAAHRRAAPAQRFCERMAGLPRVV